MNSDYGKDKANVLDMERPATIEEVDAATYGQVDIPKSDIIRAIPIAIDDIWPDITQPRRAIPAAVRGEWRGDPGKVFDVLETWRIAAEQAGAISLDVTRCIMSHGDGAFGDGRDGSLVLNEYLELLSLAASILHDGLLNPISVVRRAHSYLIETGERRWLAYHLLRKYADPAKYGRIPARLRERVNVWQQAAENGARRPLNAIGMARQLALLIMDMYQGDPAVRFDRFEDAVLPGESDRRFYAQVANGNVYRIKRGMGQRILDVTGLKSTSQVAQYRALLSIPDEIWLLADLESWPEFRIREEAKPEVEDTNTFTVVNVSDENRPQERLGARPHDYDLDGGLHVPESPQNEAYDVPDCEDMDDLNYEGPDVSEPNKPEEKPRPILASTDNVALFLAHLAKLNKEIANRQELPNAVLTLTRLDFDQIERMVAGGDSEVYTTMLNGYYDLIAEFVQARMEELNAFVDDLWQIGVELSGDDDDA